MGKRNMVVEIKTVNHQLCGYYHQDAAPLFFRGGQDQERDQGTPSPRQGGCFHHGREHR